MIDAAVGGMSELAVEFQLLPKRPQWAHQVPGQNRYEKALAESPTRAMHEQGRCLDAGRNRPPLMIPRGGPSGKPLGHLKEGSAHVAAGRSRG